MGVAAAGAVGAVVAAVRVGADVVAVVGDRLDVVVGVRVEVRARLPLVAAALDDVVAVRDDAGLDERLAVLVEVEAPGVARAVGEDLEVVPRRVIAPDAGVDRRAVLVRRAGLADLRVGEDAVAAVEPAVRAPGEGVQRLVRVLVAPAVEQDLRRAGGLVVAVLDRDEQQVRRRADPDAAEADLDAADEVQALDEDGALVELAVAVGVLEDQDAVAWPRLSGAADRDSVVRLRHPEPAAVVDGEGDRLMHVRLAGEQRDLEALGHGHRLGRLLGRQAGVLVDVRRRQRCGVGRGGTFGFSAWKRKSSKLTWPQWPVCLSTRRMKISLPMCGCRSTTTRRRFSSSSPRRGEKTLPVSLRTSSTQVSGYGPPPTRKRRPRVRHLERHARSACPCGLSPLRLVAADPVLALVLALACRCGAGRRCRP